MQLEIDIATFSRVCAATERPLLPGDVYFSLLELQANEVVRQDFSADAWRGASEDCVGWWRSRVPAKGDAPPAMAPIDVMLNLFEALEEVPAELEFRYLLGLLLLRRKSLRRDDSTRDDQGREVLILHCSRREKEFELIVAEPTAEQTVKIQQKMFDLLYSNRDSTPGKTVSQFEPSKPVA
ncbi:hypothetical protein [Bythopirellula polymerisocia]|uniref:Uncharacterized protein n=1 Tax=Bythopirellula polymerisocia TaxID=2528003 RepID=A0A5C6CME4_9BACT|nr:hypothetical protein [Bythopirellula polymerisocia]TWU26103.1 hypothetical protein Pla144_33200 [Bythopirellula polymerisocia]